MPKATNRHPSVISLLTIAATATRLGCSDMHVYRLIASGELEAVDIAQAGARRSKTRVRSDHVVAFIERKTRRAHLNSTDRDADVA